MDMVHIREESTFPALALFTSGRGLVPGDGPRGGLFRDNARWDRQTPNRLPTSGLPTRAEKAKEKKKKEKKFPTNRDKGYYVFIDFF